MLNRSCLKNMLCPVGAWQLFHWLALLIASMHFFGFWLMLWQPTSAFFVSLTPLNLLISLGMLLYFHSHRTLLFFISCLLIWAGGFLVELAGVQTGQLFGQYAYGDVLGIKLWDTPLIIGVNWLLLIYAISALVAHQPWQIWQKALFVGTGMTLMDVLIEPFAIRFGLWHWFGESVPLQNYIAWLITGTIMAAVFLYLNQKISLKNRMAAVVLLSQCFFFCAHNLAIWFVA